MDSQKNHTKGYKMQVEKSETHPLSCALLKIRERTKVLSATQSVFFSWRNENAVANTIAKKATATLLIVVVSVLIFWKRGMRGARKKGKQCFLNFWTSKILLLLLLLLWLSFSLDKAASILFFSFFIIIPFRTESERETNFVAAAVAVQLEEQDGRKENSGQK